MRISAVAPRIAACPSQSFHPASRPWPQVASTLQLTGTSDEITLGWAAALAGLRDGDKVLLDPEGGVLEIKGDPLVIAKAISSSEPVFRPRPSPPLLPEQEPLSGSAELPNGVPLFALQTVGRRSWQPFVLWPPPGLSTGASCHNALGSVSS